MTIENIDISSKEFIKLSEGLNKSSEYIFRGQSNSFFKNKFIEWKIISSYNRNDQYKKIRFNSFLTQQIEDSLFDIFYRNNEFVKNQNLENIDLTSRLYFLQHYGIGTCLLDFTHNPLTALYFAMSSLNAHSGGTYTTDGFPNYYPEECTVSIFQINTQTLIDEFGIKEINNKIGYEYYQAFQFITNIKTKKYVHMGIDLNPTKQTKKIINNYNLNKQEGAFVLFDNYYNREYDLIEFVKDYVKENCIELNNPIITHYRIKYNEFYKPMRSRQPNFKSVFRILKERNKTGEFLFNDIQGLKYDLPFFYEQ